MAPTLEDVARHAGVSLATASRVLNGNNRVKPENRDRVLASIEALNYKPNLLASALATKQSRTIGMLVPDITNPFFAEISRGVEDACNAYGFNVVMANTDEDVQRQRSYIQVLQQKGIDGIVFSSAEVDDPAIAELVASGYPSVFISREVEGVEADAVEVDDFLGGYLATRRLLDLGHVRIAHLAGPLRTRPGVYRKKGYEAAMERAGLTVDSKLVEVCDFNVESGEKGTEAILARVSEPPTAVFAGNDMIAIGAMRALRRHGLRIPDDVSLIGYDHTLIAETTEPPLTSMEQPMREMGRRAATLLLERLQGKRTGTERISLPVRLHEGGSTRALTSGGGGGVRGRRS